ncbi:tyrosine-type recombinase/integrase [Salmonella enterica]|uniref:tyrosine-type recombinase/integrase n=1 Tax=Salmonella enterica TaxID=28901 RepID=UPI0016045083|nr:site-specific integrase [Salmonella enterica]
MYKIKIDKFRLDSGERYCIVTNKETGIPLYYPNLYLTIQFRNNGHALATIESKAVNITIFYRFLEKNDIDIEKRILGGIFLSGGEIESMVSYLGVVSELRNSINIGLGYVSKKTLRNRMNSIISYITWLVDELLQYDSSRHKTNFYKMIKAIEVRRPRGHDNKNSEDNKNKTLKDDSVVTLMKLIDPQSPSNPFNPNVRNRNAIIIMILTELGIRRGELLNIKLEDINFQKKRICIRRRADEISDPRLNQPLVKTHSRELPLSEVLASRLMEYIIHDRKLYLKGKSDFLFITYKNGPCQGKPLSISGYQKIISKISISDRLLRGFSGHKLRHTWNYDFSRFMDSQNQSERKQELMREKLMGWKEGSGTASTYNRRFIEEQADEASIRYQKKYSYKGKGSQNDE